MKNLHIIQNIRTFAAAIRKIRCIRRCETALIKGYGASEGCYGNSIFNQKTNMYLDQAKKVEIFGQYGKDAKDTGSVESQVALFTYRIQHLTEHLKKNKKDFGTARSLTKMVGRRRKLLKYLYNKDINRYRSLIKALGLRK